MTEDPEETYLGGRRPSDPSLQAQLQDRRPSGPDPGAVTAVRFVGEGAILAELDDQVSVHRLVAAVAGAGVAGVEDVVPGACTVTILADPLRCDVAALAAGLPTWELAPQEAADARTHEVPVVYDGEDLGEVGAMCDLSTEEVVHRHTAPTYTVAFLGFSPGFAYLTGLDPALTVPRRATPRTAVPAGSVALAEDHTTLPPDHARRVAADRAHPDGAVRPCHRSSCSPAPRRPGPSGGGQLISVVSPGPLTTVQDLGRVGLAHLGVPRAGAIDLVSLRLANRLVANPDGAPALEATVSGPQLIFSVDTTIALVGGHVEAAVDGAAVPTAETIFIRAGQTLRMGQVRSGLRTYLAVAGGIDVPSVLGSASRDTLSGIGPAPLRAGDPLRVGAIGNAEGCMARLRVDRSYSADNEVRVVLGPRDDRATAAGLTSLLGQEFSVTPSSDRTGARLAGPAIELVEGAAPLQSEAMVAGAIQVPPDGQPIVLLANHATHGGYPVVAVVAGADLALVGQSRPAGRVKFRRISAEQALEALRAQERQIDEAVLPQGASRTRRKPSA